MAIVIISNLEPRPRKTNVPGDVALEQVLLSDGVSEQVVSEFRLADGHDIWFHLPSGTPSKSITFQNAVGGEDTHVTYNVSLMRHVGTSIDGTIGIDQKLTDASGSQTPDHCVVVIL